MSRLTVHLNQMTTPCYSGRYRFQVELKGLSLPVTITIPDIPDTTPSNDDPSGSLIVSPTETHCVASDSMSHRLSIATQRPEDDQALKETTDSPDTSIQVSIDDLLSVSLFCSVRSQFETIMPIGSWNKFSHQDHSPNTIQVPMVLYARDRSASEQPVQYSWPWQSRLSSF